MATIRKVEARMQMYGVNAKRCVVEKERAIRCCTAAFKGFKPHIRRAGLFHFLANIFGPKWALIPHPV